MRVDFNFFRLTDDRQTDDRQTDGQNRLPPLRACARGVIKGPVSGTSIQIFSSLLASCCLRLSSIPSLPIGGTRDTCTTSVENGTRAGQSGVPTWASVSWL